MDAPSTRGSMSLQIETWVRSDVSDPDVLPPYRVTEGVTPTPGQDPGGTISISMPHLPNEIISLVSQLLDWRDSVHLGSTCTIVRDALERQHALYATFAGMADLIHRWEGSKWLSQFSTALRKIDALPWATRPPVLQLFVQRIARAERNYDAPIRVGGAYVSEAIKVWRTKAATRQCEPAEHAARLHWTETEAAIKLHVKAAPSDVLRHTALRQICHAKVYLPWLGLVCDPKKHLDNVVKDIATLPYSEWSGILCVLRPLLDVPPFTELNEAFHDFSMRVTDANSPIPRPLLIDILRHLSEAGSPGLAHGALHTRFAVSAAQDLEGIVEAFAQNIVDMTLATHRTGTGYTDHGERTPSTKFLRRLSGWGNGDAMLATHVNRCFVRGIAALPPRRSVDWASLPVAVRHHYERKVIGVSIDSLEAWGCSRAITSRFWPFYLDVTGTSGYIGTMTVWQKVLSAPWQLQSVLLHEVWKRYVLRSVDFDDAFAARMSTRCIAWESQLSAQALAAKQPALALRAIVASARWQATCAKERCDDWTSHERWDAEAGRPIYPMISADGIGVIQATSPTARMALVGALSAMRPSLVAAGYLWCFDTMMFNTVRDVLCDPTAFLLRPSSKVVHAIADVVAALWARIPEVGDATVSRFDRLATRLDLGRDARDLVWSRVLMHLVVRIKSNTVTFEETLRQGDASTQAEQEMLLLQLSRASS